MKLIKRTYSLTLIWLLPVLLVGSLFCFYMIEFIAYEETDEYLTYEMERLVNYHTEFNDLPEYHNVSDILPGIKYEKPIFKDTLLLESGDNEMVPFRELYFTINHKGQDFTIVLRHLLLGRDDVAEGTLLIISGLMLLTAFSIILIINIVTGKLWKPFYNTLEKAIKFKIGGALPVFSATNIDEFKNLNQTLDTLLKKTDSDYRHNKEFNENLSHELQTQLAVIRTNTEKILNEVTHTFANSDDLKSIYTAVTKLSQVQKSLLLLSKINNLEYVKHTNTDIRVVLQQTLDTFSEVIEIRGISLNTRLDNCNQFMDAGLSEILINNLIKNAVKHNIDNGSISVLLDQSSLAIENSGQKYTGDPNILMQRFVTGINGNYGIGLSIVKQICELYNFKISYEITDQYVHRITIFFGN